MYDIELVDIPILCQRLPRSFTKILRRSLVAQDLMYLQRYPNAQLLSARRHFSRGLLTVANALMHAGFDVHYTNRVPLSDHMLHEIAQQSQFVGLYSMTVTFPYVKQICFTLKSFNPGLTTIVGGPHVTFADIDTINTGAVDIVVRGEGETTICEILDRYPHIEDIAGITYRNLSGRLVRNPKKPSEYPLTNYLPAYDLLDGTLSSYKFNIPSARGCSAKCPFCLDWRLSGRVRARSIENVIQELAYLSQFLPKYEVIQFSDSILTANPQRVKQLCEAIKASSIDFYYFCDSTADTLSAELVKCMDSVGFIGFKMGIEAEDPEILRLAKKPNSYSQYVEGAKLIHRNSAALVTAYWLSGLPGASINSLVRTKEIIRSLLEDGRIDILSHKLFVPYPGTLVFERPFSFRGKIRTRDWKQYDRLFPSPVFLGEQYAEVDWIEHMLEIESIALRIYCQKLGMAEKDLDNVGVPNSYKVGYCNDDVIAFI